MKVGFSTLNITPDLENRKKPLQLAGYSPRELCTGVHDDIYARAVYFEGKENDISTHILMIICDIVSINSNFTDIIKNCISTRIPINSENIMISATHTHHGPDYEGIFRPGGIINFFKGILFPRPQTEELFKLGKDLVKIAKKAYDNRKAAKIGSTQTYISNEDRVMINRRDPFNYESTKYPLTVIKVISDENNDRDKLIGIIINYACHGTVLPRENTLITADYMGYIIRAIEKEYPDLKGSVIYFNGPCGEINPLSSELKQKMEKKGPSKLTSRDIYQQIGTWNDARHIGNTIANYSLKVLTQINCESYSNLKVVNKTIKIPIKDYPYGSDIKSASNRIIFRLKRRLLSTLKKLNILKSSIFINVERTDIKNHVDTIVQLIDIGDFLIPTAPGEYFMELGNEVINFARSLFPSKNCFMIELANDSIGYLFTIQAYLEGGYESAFSVTPLGGRFITMKLKQFIKELV